jgi:NADH-quinone oxidoreductase subunit F
MNYLLPDVPVTDVEEYLAAGGGRGWERAVELGPAQTIKEVGLARLRGRGGAGFPTGRKWAAVAAAENADRYVVCNAAEGEPGTFKDRALLRRNPYQTAEGLLIAAHAVGATAAYVGIKASFTTERERLVAAVEELQQAGIGPDISVTVVPGPDEYLFGEEKALLEVIEGKPPLPRWFPPHEHGLFATGPQEGWEAGPRAARLRGEGANPTVVNNVETLANVPHILANGAEWFRGLGTPDSPGHVVVTVVGDVVRAGVAEVPMGTPLAEAIEQAGGGLPDGRSAKAVFSGVANPVLTAAQLGTPLTYEDMQAAGSGLGAAGFIVYDDTACMVAVALAFSRFLWVESCGQCPPCKLGSQAITEHLAAVESGSGTDLDIEEIGFWLERVTDANRCYLGTEEKLMVASVLRAFPEEFADHLEGRCPRPRPVVLPKVVDITPDGAAVFDTRQARKRPDWTYDDAP